MTEVYCTIRAFDSALYIKPYPKATSILGKQMYVILKAFVYYVGAKGSMVTVRIPEGYMTDGASVPKWFTWLLPAMGKYAQAAVVHDYLCEYLTVHIDGTPRPISRNRADLIFLEAMGVLDIPVYIKYPMYWAVASWTWYAEIKKPKFNKKKYQLEVEYREQNRTPEMVLPYVEHEDISQNAKARDMLESTILEAAELQKRHL